MFVQVESLSGLRVAARKTSLRKIQGFARLGHLRGNDTRRAEGVIPRTPGDIAMDQAPRPAQGTAGDGAHLQPDETPDVDKWLTDAEFDQKTAELAERLGGDEELLLKLQLSSFADRDWNPVAQELARYGYAVISSWIRNRSIYRKVKQRTGYGLSALDDWPTDDHTVSDIATDTVIDALHYFKTNVLMTGKWDPTKGASLRTYFIGQCLYKFANCYRKHYDAEVLRRTTEFVADDETLAVFASSIRGIEEAVVTSAEVRDALASVSTAHAKIALMLSSQGYTHQEIADRVGIAGGAKAVENMIAYQKKKLVRKSS